MHQLRVLIILACLEHPPFFQWEVKRELFGFVWSTKGGFGGGKMNPVNGIMPSRGTSFSCSISPPVSINPQRTTSSLWALED